MWKHTAFMMLALLSLAIVVDRAWCSEPQTLKQLLKTEKTEYDRGLSTPCVAVKYYVGYHSGPPSPWFRGQKRILVISWFRGNGTTALRYEVIDSGRVHDVRDVHNWARQAGHDKQLEEEQLKILRQLLPQLPKSTADPPINRTVYVSFVDKNDWRTETYDAEKLPSEFESVMNILGERFETRDRKTVKPN